ncbi:MAG: IS3 family transposase [Sulfuritalea sp.]|nr:IS3 family transposase [Sulfuritalea sp.]
MICSMSRAGKLLGQRATESFFNSPKNEQCMGTRHSTRPQREANLFDYIEPFYNRRRQHSTPATPRP